MNSTSQANLPGATAEERTSSRAMKFLNRVFNPTMFCLLIGFVFSYVPGAEETLKWAYTQLPATIQAAILVAAALCAVYFALVSYIQSEKVEGVRQNLANVEGELAAAHNTIKGLESQMLRAAETEDLWKRPATMHPLGQTQGCQFLSVINLKGGPGKTTLTANVAACLALMQKPLSVLVVDLDFQGTLTNQCVRPEQVDYLARNNCTSARLLDEELADPDLESLLASMQEIPGNNVIIARDKLAAADSRVQAGFLLNDNSEIRFRFRENLRKSLIHEKYQLVIFDCPPRLTASTVNALACSDSVLIPSELDDYSIEAVRRTLEILRRFRHFAQPEVLGIVANKVQYWRKDQLVKVHANGLNRLERMVKAEGLKSPILESKIKLHAKLIEKPEQGIVRASKDSEVAELFADLAEEIRKGLRL